MTSAEAGDVGRTMASVEAASVTQSNRSAIANAIEIMKATDANNR
jgi:hypothetical protein